MKIDAVYTWVDPKNNGWIQERQKYLRDEPRLNFKTDFSRYMSNDEIKYSIRSLFLHCDFIQRVYIVSNNGSKPEWLANTDKIIIIDDRSIFPDAEMLPNFNSNAIESCLHRIPGLSDYFIYLNDDFLITKNLSIDELIDLSTQRCAVFLETDPIVSIYNRYLSKFLPELQLLGGCAAKARMHTYQKIGLANIHNIPIGHCCRVYTKKLLVEFEQNFPMEIDAVRHQRFRNSKSFCYCDAYSYYFQKMGMVEFSSLYKTKLILFTDNRLLNAFQLNNAL